MTKILVTYASSGSGHRSAAYALEQAFLQRNETVQVEDALQHGSAFYRRLYTGFYQELSENAPVLWEYAYKLTDKTDKNDTQFINGIRILLDRMGVTELDALVEEVQPDAIVCTHFLPLHLLTHLKQRGRISVPIYCAVTDYTGNAKWVCSDVTNYFTATPLVSSMLIERGAEAGSMMVTGIPIDPAIAKPNDGTTGRQKYQIDHRPVITLIGSALNVDRVRAMVNNLLKSTQTGTLVVVAGRNEVLDAALANIQEEKGETSLHLKILGYVEDLDNLIAASDLVITKSGGLIISEIMARNTPMVIVDPIPGQEHWNADYVVSVGAGVQVRLTEMIPSVVQGLLNNPERLKLMRQNAKKAAYPHAALTIADHVLTNVPKQGEAVPSPA